MNLNNENTTALLESKFAIDFVTITLTQKGCDNPIVYSGPGTITQNEDGRLHLKLYHSFVDVQKELFGKTGEIVPGKIMGDEHYFSLVAVDMRGEEWTADKVYVSGGLSLPAAGKVVTSIINELTKVEVRQNGTDRNQSSLLMLVKGKFSVPANNFEDRNGYRHLNTFKMESETFSIELKDRDDHLLARMTAQKVFFTENTPDILLEALGIVFGKVVTPVYLAVAHDEKVVTSLISTPGKFPNTNISEPIPYKFPHHGSPLKDFLERYLSFATTPYTELFGYWRKINRSWQGGIVNAALTVTVAIEGIIKSYFKEHGYPDEDFMNQVDAAIEPIKSLAIGPRAKDRIIASINGAKSSNPRSALFKLSENGCFAKELVEDWKSLRNMSAHADKLDPDQVQKYIDNVYKCLLLFYKLMFIVLKYQNLYFDFAKKGWPETMFTLQEEKKTIA